MRATCQKSYATYYPSLCSTRIDHLTLSQYFGHKIPFDQNEKLSSYGVTHVPASDGYSGIAGHSIYAKRITSQYMMIFSGKCLFLVVALTTSCKSLDLQYDSTVFGIKCVLIVAASLLSCPLFKQTWLNIEQTQVEDLTYRLSLHR